ncbi:MAG: aminotransferase class I/II-fold pyridoxal phosphate-dependent enzyme [Magnetospirillum sp.]|nr:aminotransferase class I/II-fold pyridoxal phosphate-dependent enzyme [Magnetospirillum sp.]
MITPRLQQLNDYPFQRLADLLGGVVPPDAVVMSIGEPQHVPPPMVASILAEQAASWGKYPSANGTPAFRRAVADWLTRRFGLPDEMIDPDRMILPVAGTREALYMIAQAVRTERGGKAPAMLLPNPFYQVYAGAAAMAGAEPVFVPGADGVDSFPDFSALPAEILDRTALAYLCTPANPVGTVADIDLLVRAVATARRHGFLLAVDECYSEIWDRAAPAGALSACARLDGETDNVIVFHSLSKRSSVPGLRSGFVAGDPAIIAAFARLRAYGGAVTPLPIIAAATALWQDEAHVEENRALYRAKFDIAERILGDRFGFRRPEGTFFLWLDVGDGEAAALALWREAKIRVIPGAYMARAGADGINPGKRFIRAALVHGLATTERVLTRFTEIL